MHIKYVFSVNKVAMTSTLQRPAEFQTNKQKVLKIIGNNLTVGNKKSKGQIQ